MKKVVMLASNIHPIPPTVGAAVETWIYEVSKRILKYQMHIISISNEFYNIKEFKNGIFFHRIKIGKIYKRIFQKILGWDIYSYNQRVLRIIKKINPDIIHIHNYYGSKELIKKIRKYNKNTRIILHMHNENNKFDKTFPFVDLFIGCSNYITHIYKEKIKINAKDFKTIYNGVDIDKFSKAHKYRKDLLKKKSIFYFGRISEEKGLEKVLEIAKLLQEKKEKYKIYCIGEISKKGERRDFYNSLIEKIKKDKLINIYFLDYISPQKIHIAYQMAEIIIIPSKFNEPFGMVALEAMASKVPIISVYKGGLKEYLNEKNSILIKDYNNFAIETVEKLLILSNPNIYRKFQDEEFKTAQKFDWIIIAKEMENIYDNLFN